MDSKGKLKLSLAMLAGAIVALVRPQEIRQVLDDYMEASRRRRRELLARLLKRDATEPDMLPIAQPSTGQLVEVGTDAAIELKQRLKLSLAMMAGAVVALIKPHEIRQVLDDYFEARKKRRHEVLAKVLGGQEAPSSLSQRSDSRIELTPDPVEQGRLYEHENEHSDLAPDQAKARLSEKEIKAVTMAANIAKRKKIELANAREDHEITVNDSRFVINTFMVYMATRLKRFRSGRGRT